MELVCHSPVKSWPRTLEIFALIGLLSRQFIAHFLLSLLSLEVRQHRAQTATHIKDRYPKMMYPRTAVAILALTGLATSSIGSANAFVAPAHSVPSSVAASSASSSTSALFVAFGSSSGGSSAGSSASDDGETFASALARGWRPERGSFAGLRRKDRATGTILPMYEDDTGAIMPDGGLSPCVIKVIGVGGGGCNAVSGFAGCLVLE